MESAAEVFHRNFLNCLTDAGMQPAQIARHAWRPYRVADLGITGAARDHDLSKLSLPEQDVARVLQETRGAHQPVDLDYLRTRKIALVLVPGYTHETLRNLSWHQEMNRRDTPHSIVMLHPGGAGQPTREEHRASGDGLRVVYARYPRSNAASEHINEPLFHLLHNSATLRRWVEEDGYQLLFVGYSYGSPLSLELLAALNSGRFEDQFLLQATAGFFGLCGDIGGAYLADDVIRPDATFISIQKVIDLARRNRLVAAIAGLGTKQLQDDMFDGVKSLGHAERQAHLREYAPKLPGDVFYGTISAVCPLSDYRRHFWQFNFDDFAMYRQALISDPVSIYNDGQVVLEDNLVPAAPQIPAERHHHLGAVRTHHWGVSYLTFNFGWNRFPRRSFYAAVLKTLFELGLDARP